MEEMKHVSKHLAEILFILAKAASVMVKAGGGRSEAKDSRIKGLEDKYGEVRA